MSKDTQRTHSPTEWDDSSKYHYVGYHGSDEGDHTIMGGNGCLYEDVLKVPSVVYSPSIDKPKKYKHLVSLLKIFPTILDFTSAEIPKGCDGKVLASLNDDNCREYVISETEDRVAVVKDGYKLTLNYRKATEQLLSKIFYDGIGVPYWYNAK